MPGLEAPGKAEVIPPAHSTGHLLFTTAATLQSALRSTLQNALLSTARSFVAIAAGPAAALAVVLADDSSARPAATPSPSLASAAKVELGLTGPGGVAFSEMRTPGATATAPTSTSVAKATVTGSSVELGNGGGAAAVETAVDGAVALEAAAADVPAAIEVVAMVVGALEAAATVEKIEIGISCAVGSGVAGTRVELSRASHSVGHNLRIRLAVLQSDGDSSPQKGSSIAGRTVVVRVSMGEGVSNNVVVAAAVSTVVLSTVAVRMVVVTWVGALEEPVTAGCVITAATPPVVAAAAVGRVFDVGNANDESGEDVITSPAPHKAGHSSRNMSADAQSE